LGIFLNLFFRFFPYNFTVLCNETGLLKENLTLKLRQNG
jgi:hypothetical protein